MGVVAMMPEEPIASSKTGFAQESFLIDTRSWSGYSGSPVFVAQDVIGRTYMRRKLLDHAPLLGIDWGYVGPQEPVREKETAEPLHEGWWVRSNAGMSAVLPTWKIPELLDLPELMEDRRMKEEAWRQQNR
jgi:hypothetical protein